MYPRILFAIIFLSIQISLHAQSKQEILEVLSDVQSLEEKEKLKARYPDWFITIDRTTQLDGANFEHIMEAKIGSIVSKKNFDSGTTFLLKVLEKSEDEFCKVQYIYLDGSKLNDTEIDSLRTLILGKYNQGEDFTDLARKFGMDGNLTGELDWFHKGMMVEEFDSAVRPRQKGEIFTVDVPSRSWYYVVLKTHKNQEITTVKSLAIYYK